MENELLQMFIETLITVLAPVFFGFLSVIAYKALNEFKAWVNTQGMTSELEIATELATRFVLAAQQNGLIGELENIGEEKKRWALDGLQKTLDSRGIHLDVDELSALLEAAYNENFEFSFDLPEPPETPPEE